MRTDAQRKKGLEYTLRWNKNNPDKLKRIRRASKLKRLFGITQAYYDELLQYQKGKCKVCGKKMHKPVVDHSHTSGKVRSLLCSNCNVGIGMFQEDTSILREAIAYLEGYNSDRNL